MHDLPMADQAVSFDFHTEVNSELQFPSRGPIMWGRNRRYVARPGVGVLPVLLGFAVDNLITDGNYQKKLWNAISRAAAERGIHLVTLVGGTLNVTPENEFELCRNPVYRFASDELIDGVVVSGTIGNFGTFADLAAFHESINKPTISIATPMETVPGVSAENYQGTQRLMDHLFAVHGCSRIAFIRGPEYTPETEQRYRAYADALGSRDLPVDQNLVVRGDFSAESGARAIGVFSDEQLSAIDAIVAANDNMALGALSALKARGLRVPDDVIVAGFDDSEESAVSAPTLTTVRQSTEEIAGTALDLLVRRIRGEDIPHLVEVPSELVIRSSCGCVPDSEFESTHPEVYRGSAEGTADDPLDEEAILKDLMEDLGDTADSHGLDNRRIRRIVASGVKCLQHEEATEEFIRTLAEVNTDLLERLGDAHYSYRIIDGLERSFLARVSDPAVLRRVSLTIGRAVAEVGEANLRHTISHRLMLEEMSRMLLEASRALLVGVQIDRLMQTVEQQLPRFGIRECYVFLKNKLIDGRADDTFHLIEAFDDDGRRGADVQREYVDSDVIRMLTANGNASDYVFESLYFRTQVFGFIVLRARPATPFVVESLITQICSALNGWSLLRDQTEGQEKLRRSLDKIEAMNRSLEKLSITDELTGLSNRRGFFTLGEPQIRIACRKHDKLLVLYLDLDHLKQINDQYGHDVGDQAIIFTAKQLRATMRDSDIVARLGGDEFTAIAVDSSFADIPVIEKKIKDGLAELTARENLPYRLSCTMGFAELDPDEPSDLEELLRIADQDLYERRKRIRGE
jgi:diguanylate cyclase (GGDEF)-like protein